MLEEIHAANLMEASYSLVVASKISGCEKIFSNSTGERTTLCERLGREKKDRSVSKIGFIRYAASMVIVEPAVTTSDEASNSE